LLIVFASFHLVFEYRSFFSSNINRKSKIFCRFDSTNNSYDRHYPFSKRAINMKKVCVITSLPKSVFIHMLTLFAFEIELKIYLLPVR